MIYRFLTLFFLFSPSLAFAMRNTEPYQYIQRSQGDLDNQISQPFLEAEKATQERGACRRFLKKSGDCITKTAHFCKTPFFVFMGIGLSYLAFWIASPTFETSIKEGVKKAVEEAFSWG